MYYPYFRGKQFDLLALKTMVEEKRLSKSIVPIIEPVKNSATLKNTIETFEKHQQSYYLISNPQAGDFLTPEGPSTIKKLSSRNARIFDGVTETESSKEKLLIVPNGNLLGPDDFLETTIPTIVPLEFRVLKKVKAPLILSTDPFTRIRNSFYEEVPDEFFSGDYLTYQARGFQGFSDFTIDSRIYYEQGYPAKILVLHLIYSTDQGIRIHHFTSPELPEADMKARFLAMMGDIKENCSRYWPKGPTAGLSLLLQAAAADGFPGLGVMRKAMVMHHLEIMGRVLK